MAEIRLNVSIKTGPETIYNAIITQEGLMGWRAKQTVARPEIGHVNVFTFGTSDNEMKIVDLVENQKVEWECINSTPEWMETTLTFELEPRE